MQSAATQSAATQDRQAVPGDDITRRDLARFDQFLDSHREIADQLRRTPSLIDDPQFLQSHPELNAYLEDHPSVKLEISQRPDTFMRLEDLYARDANQRDRDAGWQDRDAGGRDMVNRDAVNFDRFLDQHREIGEQVRKDPSLLDDRKFVDGHPALETYLHDNPGVRDQLRLDPDAFMRLADRDNRDLSMNDRDAGGQDRDAYRRDGVNRDAVDFDRFLDQHREIGEQVRKDPSLLDDRKFVDGHPALETYLESNPGVRDQLRQDPNTFMQLADRDNRDLNGRDRDPRQDRMADFGGFLGSHSGIQRDLSRDPSVVKDRQYVEHHAELDAYLNAHPDVRNELMANPQDFVHGAQQYSNAGAAGAAGAGVNGRGTGAAAGFTGAAGASAGTPANPATPTHEPAKPNQ